MQMKLRKLFIKLTQRNQSVLLFLNFGCAFWSYLSIQILMGKFDLQMEHLYGSAPFGWIGANLLLMK